MSAWTPILEDLDAYSPALSHLVHNSLDALQSQRASLLLSKKWHASTKAAILEHDTINEDEFLTAIAAWMYASTKKRIQDVPVSDILDTFLETQYFVKNREFGSAILVLAKLQNRIERQQFPKFQHQYHQHNLLEELTSPVDDDLTLEDDSSGTPEDTDPSSPPRKRVKTYQVNLTFEEFNALPIHARNISKWNSHLKQNHNFWLPICQDWKETLQMAYNQRNESNLNRDKNIHFHGEVVDTLRAMRQVAPAVYKEDEWQAAVKKSSLYDIVNYWSEPGGLVKWTAPFVITLMRKNRIADTLLLVLLDWIPSGVKDFWDNLEVPKPLFSVNSQYMPSNPGKALYDALKNNPDMIPRQALPSSIYFLLNFKNFYEAGVTWLGYSYELRRLNARFLNNKDDAKRTYDDFMKLITPFKKTHFEHIKDENLRLIFVRTIEFRDLLGSVKKKFLKNRASLNVPCKECINEPKDLKCIQICPVDFVQLPTTVLGNGVSFSPREDIDAVPIQNSKDGKFKECPVLHPVLDLKLQRIAARPEVIEKCGSMTYYFCDSAGDVLDFWTFGAFPEDTLTRLNSHHDALQNVKALRCRGKQFETYSQGQMYPKGSRAPAGGSPGDAYTMYAGMEAVDEASMNALFNDAEDCMILMELARVIHPRVACELKEAASIGDKLGISGTTAYLCKNYTSPLHRDNDVSPGLCAQLKLQAAKEGDEYGFVYGDYCLYVVSQTNSLWSFDGRHTHGTVLPSKIPLNSKDISGTIIQGGQPGDGEDPPPRVSNGIHVTKTKRNHIAAKRYEDVRKSMQKMQEHWNK